MFIVFEGIDGSGKTTQARKLVKKLNKIGRPAVFEHEPTDGDIGRLIKAALSGAVDATPETVALLFAADRREHVRKICALNKAGTTVVCDRFFLSSLAYQGLDIPMDDVVAFNKTVIDSVRPDLTFFLDTDVDICAERVSRRSRRDVYENKQTLLRVRQNYIDAMERFSDHSIVVVSDDAYETVWRHVLALI